MGVASRHLHARSPFKKNSYNVATPKKHYLFFNLYTLSVINGVLQQTVVGHFRLQFADPGKVGPRLLTPGSYVCVCVCV